MAVKKKKKHTTRDIIGTFVGAGIVILMIYVLFFSPQYGIFGKKKDLIVANLPIITFSDTPTPTITFTPTPLPPPQLDVMKIFNLINDYRVSKGLGTLSFDQNMCPFANKRLQQIHTDHTHSGFDAEVGKTFCAQCHHAGENLAGDQWSEEQLVQGWIHSPDHLANIVQPDYTVTCVATDTVGYHTYSVQEFSSNF